MSSETIAYRAAWVISIDREPIRDGVVTIQQDRSGVSKSKDAPLRSPKIVSVEPWSPKKNPHARVVDLGAVALIPALINAHTHLEFSHLKRPLLQRGCPFTDWIRAIVRCRHETTSHGIDPQDAIESGLKESAAAGVTCIGEIASSVAERRETSVASSRNAEVSRRPLPESAEALSAGETTLTPTVVRFLEQLGRDETQFAEKLELTKKFVTEASPPNRFAAISPHAPYSVHPQLLRFLCEMAIQSRVPVAMHVAETLEERELLEQQTGPFVDLLKDFGVWNPATFLPRQTMLNVLETLSQTPRSLVVHGNYLTGSEFEFIAQHRDTMSIVYCPRTHDYFDHARYPLDTMRKLGINVAIGTDSRASNPDLDLWADLRMIAQKFPQVPASEILQMGTINGAKGLGVDHQFGSITPGKSANLIAIKIPSDTSKATTDFEWFFSGDTVRFNLECR